MFLVFVVAFIRRSCIASSRCFSAPFITLARSAQDMLLAVDSESEESYEGESEGEFEGRSSDHPRASLTRRRRLVTKHKLVIIMVGLPGRGKTFLCNKIKCYLTWLGHSTRHFNVGMYRCVMIHSSTCEGPSLACFATIDGFSTSLQAPREYGRETAGRGVL